MKKQILNLGKALNKAEQKQVNGEGSVCDYYIENGLCFGPVPGCVPCSQLHAYPDAISCVFIHSDCFQGDVF
ncbi:hypothetical protein C7447_101952 [Tenacibaculum adriaticum]|uniref:Uncharacterized protein n=1 Tax=Tenacibaculum adriaticum TaxID=413713 RepID=A0A5S5E0U0_9FLAO|nr:hypothetical protein [Tenacibaculum adriaticum]TYQ00340.1 hypothetical protein C7447_101952 [Tenacibaculum adriaticum]